jgi:hypothetical protein
LLHGAASAQEHPELGPREKTHVRASPYAWGGDNPNFVLTRPRRNQNTKSMCRTMMGFEDAVLHAFWVMDNLVPPTGIINATTEAFIIRAGWSQMVKYVCVYVSNRLPDGMTMGTQGDHNRQFLVEEWGQRDTSTLPPFYRLMVETLVGEGRLHLPLALYEVAFRRDIVGPVRFEECMNIVIWREMDAAALLGGAGYDVVANCMQCSE